MRKVQMFGADKIEVNFEEGIANIAITNNKSKMSAGFSIGKDRVIKQIVADHKPSGKAMARALSIYDSMHEEVTV